MALIRMGTIEDAKFKILAFLIEVKEANAKQLEKKAGCANKTFLKARQQLEQQGLVQKRYQNRKEGGLEAIYSIPQEKLQTVKLMLEREALKKNCSRQIDNLGPDDIEFYKQKLNELEKELKWYKQLPRLIDLTLIECLPAKAILEKLEQKGLGTKDLDSNMLINIYDIPDFRPEDVEVFLIPASELNTTETITDPSRISHSILEKYVPIEKHDPIINMIPWILLTPKPVKNYYIVGAYKIFSENLFDSNLFHRSWHVDWKGYYELPEKDWNVIKPKIREIVIKNAGRKDLDDKISTYIINYLVNTKGDAFQRLKKIQLKYGASEKLAEEIARKSVEEAKKAAENEQKTP